MAETTSRIGGKSALKGKGGLIAMAVVAVLAVVLFVDFKRPVPKEGAEAPVSEYAGISADDVIRAELRRPDGGFTVSKQNGKWAIQAPGRYRASTDRVNEWLKSTLDEATPSYTVPSKPDLASIGLDKPQYELVLTGKSAGTKRLQIGSAFKTSDTAEPSLYYAREAQDGRIFMLTLASSDNVRTKRLDDLRDKRLLDVADDKQIQKIVLQGRAGTTEVDRQGEEKWQLVQPFKAPADKFDVEGLAGTLKSSEADSFVEKPETDLSKYGLDKPFLTVQVTDRAGTRAVLFGSSAKDSKYYAVRQGDPEVFLVAKTTLDSLDKKASDLRDKKLVTLDKDKITSLELRNASGSTQLQKSGGSDWTIANPTDPKQKKAKLDVVQHLLDAIANSAAKHVEEAPTDLAKYGLNQPQITVTASEGTGPSQVVQIGKKAPDGNYYAKGTTPAVFELASYSYADLNVKPPAFVDTSAAPPAAAPKVPGPQIPAKK